MPIHLRAPFAAAAAAAWGALQDCESDTVRDSPRDGDDNANTNNNDENNDDYNDDDEHDDEEEAAAAAAAIEKSLNSYCHDDDSPFHEYQYYRNNNRGGGGVQEGDLAPSHSIQHSTSTFNDGPAGAGVAAASFEEQQQQQPPSIRMINSFGPSTTNHPKSPNKKLLQSQTSTLLRRGSSQLSAVNASNNNNNNNNNVWSGFVDGDFASGKVRDIPVDGCFVMAFQQQPTCALLAVGARQSVDFYETTNYTIAHRFYGVETQVSALEWLFLIPTNNNNNKHQDDKKKESSSSSLFGKSLLAVGDLGGNVLLLQIQDEVLETYGPTVLHQFQVHHQVRAIDLALVGNVILMAIGDKGGGVTFSIYSQHDLQPLSNPYLAHQITVDNDRVLSLSLTCCSDHRYLAFSTMGGDVAVFGLVEKKQNKNQQQQQQATRNIELSPQPLFSHTRRGAVRSVSFSPTGLMLALGGYDKTLVLVDTRLWRVVRELKLDGTINVIKFDPFDRFLGVGTRDKSFVLFDTSTFAPIKTFSSPGWVTSISWGARNSYKDCVAFRTERGRVSLLDLTPISKTTYEFDGLDGTAEECAVSWSKSGRYCARLQGSAVYISDSHNSFRDAARFEADGTLRGIAFCPAEGKDNLLAVVGLEGHLTVLRMRSMGIGSSFEVVKAVFVEENLWVVSWSPDGSILATGGRGKNLLLLSSESLEPLADPIRIEGRIWGIDFSQPVAQASTSPRVKRDPSDSGFSSQMAVASGSDVAIIFDSVFQPFLHVHRPRTARALRYHPNLPVLAIGDGAGYCAIIDYEQEETLTEFKAGSRVNTVDFSPKGDFLVVGTDECVFTFYETVTYKPVQAVPVQGFGVVASFSPNGQCLALGTSEGIYSIVRLGPLLGIDLVPLDLHGGVEQMPTWALNEVLFRSGDGPSFIQRHMRKGDPDNLQRVARILQQHPEAIYAYDRQTKDGAFDTALLLRKPNLLKLAVTALVDGKFLKLDSDAILTSQLPMKAKFALDEIIENYPAEIVVDILREMTFIKVPFSKPVVVKATDCMERGSESYMDPWPRKNKTPNIFTDREEPLVSRGYFVRTPAVLPLPGLGKMQFLSSLLVKAPPTVFDNDAMAAVLRVLWQNHIQKYFIFDLVLYVVFFILWIILVDMQSSDPEQIQSTTIVGVAAAVFAVNTVFAAKELVQSDYGKRPGYISSFWNIVDLLSIGCVWYYILTACFLNTLEPGQEPLAVITSLLLTMKLVAYLRGISGTGWLVSVLVQNLNDVRGFLLILLIILVGFTTTFRILFGHVAGPCELKLDENEELQETCGADPFGSFQRAFVSSFQMMVLGAYEESLLYESQYTVLAILVFILAVTCVLIVALNALISILADSYARVQENAVANRRKERAELIVEYMSILPAKKRHSIEKRTTYFHALLEATSSGDLLLAKEDWQGGLKALRRDMEELVQTSAEQNQKALDQFHTEIDSELNSLRREVVSLLEDVAADIRNIRRLQSHDGITLNGKNVARAVKAVKTIGRQGQKAIFGERK